MVGAHSLIIAITICLSLQVTCAEQGHDSVPQSGDHPDGQAYRVLRSVGYGGRGMPGDELENNMETNISPRELLKKEIVNEVLVMLHKVYKQRNEFQDDYMDTMVKRSPKNKNVRFHQCYFNPISCFKR